MLVIYNIILFVHSGGIADINSFKTLPYCTAIQSEE